MRLMSATLNEWFFAWNKLWENEMLKFAILPKVQKYKKAKHSNVQWLQLDEPKNR